MRRHRLRLAGVSGGILSWLGLAVAGPAAPAPQRKDPIQWRVEGGAAALEPTAHVRIEVENAIPAEALNPRYGLVQVVVYLFDAGSPAAPRMLAAAGEPGLVVISEPEAEEGDLRVTVEIPDLGSEEPALALVVGRPVKVHGVQESAPAGRRRPGALRADTADLEERRRWSADTLLPAGSQQVLWEGMVPLETDRLYADFLAIRGRGDAEAPVGATDAADARPPGPDPGIIDLPSTKVSHPPPLPAGTTGATVTRAGGRRTFPLALERGRLNVIRLRAVQDVTGELGLELAISSSDLPAPAR